MDFKKLLALTLVVVMAACSRSSAPETDGEGTAAPAPSGDTRKYLLDRVEDAAIVQLYADGFTSLPLREKTLIYHL
jgi:dipeptidyl-peptidase III